MDKVIIDGIDVSECSYCLNNQLKGKGHAPAKSMPYAKETSCIACKEDITRLNFCKNNPNCYYKQLKRLQAENERLKEEKDGMQILIDNYIALTENYHQALQEIRDIADNFCESHCPYSDDEETNVCNESCLLDAIVNPIIDKINSVIGSEE